MKQNISWTSIDAVMERLLKTAEGNRIQKSDVIDYTTEFIQLLRRNEVLFENVAEVEVEDGVGYLPIGVSSIEGVILKSNGVPLVKSNSFCIDTISHANSGHGFYSSKGNVLYCSFQDCVLVVKYYGLPLDEHEQLLIPNNPVFIRALVSFIVFELTSANLSSSNDKNKYNQYNIRQNEYYKDFARLESMFNTLSTDELFMIANQLNTLLPRRREFLNNFSNTGLLNHIYNR